MVLSAWETGFVQEFCASWPAESASETLLEKLFEMNSIRAVFALVVFAAFGWGAPSVAQVPPNCTVEAAFNPDRQVLKCAYGLILELEAAAELSFSGDIRATDPTEIGLQNGGMLIEVEPGAARPQIKTPHAIAAVRGTVYVVDVSPERTSVFVLKGEVAVMRPGAPSEQVSVGPGEGVDVTEGAEMKVSVWPAARTQALLARFGR